VLERISLQQQRQALIPEYARAEIASEYASKRVRRAECECEERSLKRARNARHNLPVDSEAVFLAAAQEFASLKYQAEDCELDFSLKKAEMNTICAKLDEERAVSSA
jgi:hypothetical protein